MRISVTGLMIIGGGLAIACGTGQASAQARPAYTNLKVLPEDIGRSALNDIMLENLSGLGLPRRSGEGCLFCHVGSPDTPRSSWDYASDDKPTKATARVMMAMVREINGTFLAQIDERVAPSLEVGCYTCHAGRTNPMPLPDLLMSEFAKGGLAALDASYRTARARYYEADAYDFRVGTLIEVADQLAELGEGEAAASVHELNIEYYEGPEARGGLVRLRLFEALEASGSPAMIERYHQLKGAQPPGSLNAFTLDPLAWELQRSTREDAAMLLFELNYSEYPTAFTSTESLAYAVTAAGDPERGLNLARDWIAAHPEHRGGHQLLAELSRSPA